MNPDYIVLRSASRHRLSRCREKILQYIVWEYYDDFKELDLLGWILDGGGSVFAETKRPAPEYMQEIKYLSKQLLHLYMEDLYDVVWYSRHISIMYDKFDRVEWGYTVKVI